MTFGERVYNIRTQMGLTQDELANAVGYKSRSTIAKIESGDRDVSQSMIVALAKALNTTPSYLMGWLEYDENAPIIDPDDLLAGVELVERDNKKILDDCYDKADSDGKRAIVAYAQQIISNGEIPTVPDVFIDYYNRVNEEGKAAILKYVKYIASDDEYKKCDTDDSDSQGA